MNNNIKDTNCIKFEKLIYKFSCDKVGGKDKIFFEKHMLTCENCKNKYEVFKKVREDFQNIKNKISPLKNNKKVTYTINELRNLNDNLSAYVDNELMPEESIKIKKLLIRNQFAQKDFLKECKLRHMINLAVRSYKKRIFIKERIRNLLFFLKKQ